MFQGRYVKTLPRTVLGPAISFFIISGCVSFWASYSASVGLPILLVLAGVAPVHYAIISLRRAPCADSPFLL